MPLELASEPGFGSVMRQMGRMMDQLQKGFFAFCPGETWTPAVNFYETDVAYLICVDLSGVEKEKIDLEVAESRLRLRGRRNVPVSRSETADMESPKVKIHLLEIDHGPFIREVPLPQDVESERISASYVDGILWIEIPKKQ
jgi:HSP20 family protein